MAIKKANLHGSVPDQARAAPTRAVETCILMRRMLKELNSASDRVLFPKSNLR